MKRIYIGIFLTILFAPYVLGQQQSMSNHFSVKGISIGKQAIEFANAVVATNTMFFEYNDTDRREIKLQGNFAGYSNSEMFIFYTATTKSISSIEIDLSYGTRTRYEDLLSLYTEKYGAPNKKDTVVDSLYYSSKYYSFKTKWELPQGNIIINLFSDGMYIVYQDKINMSLIDRENTDAIKRDI